jgi:poly(3-hydroxybutyrate) depolymerase
MAYFLIFTVNNDAIAQTQKLPAYGVDILQTSVSGLSSGAFMTSQLHVAYSDIISAVGIIAGGPYYCAASSILSGAAETAVTTCMNPIGPGPDSEKLFGMAQELTKQGLIDNLTNLKDDKVYIFSGSSDSVVKTKVVDETTEFYQLAGVASGNLKYIKNINAGHAIITDNQGDMECNMTKTPFINDCDFTQSHEILRHVYDNMNPPSKTLSGKLTAFDQTEFITNDRSSMSKEGYVYVPASCEQKTCKVHVALHGCEQGAAVIGDKYYKTTGYNEIADTNDIIVLYPQVQPSKTIPQNPLGCWDFWGYSDSDPDNPDYYTKEAPQMMSIMKMVKRLAESKKETAETQKKEQ